MSDSSYIRSSREEKEDGEKERIARSIVSDQKVSAHKFNECRRRGLHPRMFVQYTGQRHSIYRLLQH